MQSLEIQSIFESLELIFVVCTLKGFVIILTTFVFVHGSLRDGVLSNK